MCCLYPEIHHVSLSSSLFNTHHQVFGALTQTKLLDFALLLYVTTLYLCLFTVSLTHQASFHTNIVAFQLLSMTMNEHLGRSTLRELFLFCVMMVVSSNSFCLKSN